MGGAAQGYLADLLRELGVEVHEIHADETTDRGDICPDPVEPWVDACERAVVEDGACAGLVTDGDADRIGAVDERGRYIHPHQIMALVLGDLVQYRNLKGRVVVNLSCSTLVRRIAEALGCRVVIKPVGFKYIAAEMKKGGVLRAHARARRHPCLPDFVRAHGQDRRALGRAYRSARGELWQDELRTSRFTP